MKRHGIDPSPRRSGPTRAEILAAQPKGLIAECLDRMLICAFRAKPATQSWRNRPPNPEETGHLFRLIPATCPG